MILARSVVIRFSVLPYSKLSMTRTLFAPALSRRLTKCDPMKPAPPVTAKVAFGIPVDMARSGRGERCD